MINKQFRLATQADVGKVAYFTDCGPEYEVRPTFERVLKKAYPFGMGIEKPFESVDGFRYAYAYVANEAALPEQTAKEMFGEIKSRLDDLAGAIESLNSRLEAHERIERECR